MFLPAGGGNGIEVNVLFAALSPECLQDEGGLNLLLSALKERDPALLVLLGGERESTCGRGDLSGFVGAPVLVIGTDAEEGEALLRAERGSALFVAFPAVERILRSVIVAAGPLSMAVHLVNATVLGDWEGYSPPEPGELLEERIAFLSGEGVKSHVVLFKGYDPLEKMAVCRRVERLLSAFIGVGTGVPTLDGRILEDRLFYLSDFGVPSEEGGLLRSGVTRLFHRRDRCVVLNLSSETGGLVDADDCFLDGEGEERNTGTDVSVSLYETLKRAVKAPSERRLFATVEAATGRLTGMENVAVAYSFGKGEEERFIFSDGIFPDDRRNFERYARELLRAPECMLPWMRKVDIEGVTFFVSGRWSADEDGVRTLLALVDYGGTRSAPSPQPGVIEEIYFVLESSLERLKYESSLKRQLGTVSMLLGISEELSSSIEFEEIVRSVLKVCLSALKADRVTMTLAALDDALNAVEEGGVTRFLMEQEDEECVRRESLEAGAGVLECRDSSEVEISPDKRRLRAPMHVREHLVGVLEVERHRYRSPFHDEHVLLLGSIANQAANPIENARLHENLRRMNISTVEALASAIDAKDPYTHGHSRRVTEYALAIGEELDLSREQLEELRYIGLLHDIGKIGVDDAILTKKGKLTEEERRKINVHPSRGAEILEHVSFLVSKIPGVKYHHERWDGKGYPEGLKGEDIPLYARIICIADAFDAMTSDRPYRSGMSPDIALGRIVKNSGTQFCPAMVDVFRRIYKARILPIYQRYRRERKGG